MMILLKHHQLSKFLIGSSTSQEGETLEDLPHPGGRCPFQAPHSLPQGNLPGGGRGCGRGCGRGGRGGAFPPHGQVPMPPTNSWEMHPLSSQETALKLTPSSHRGSYTAASTPPTLQSKNQYQKMMLFLTYIQHDLVHVWVVAASRWLVNKVTNFRVNQYDPYLWESIKGAFHRQFMDTLEKE